MKFPAMVFATFFGIGRFPLIPGTVASAAVLLVYRFALLGFPRAALSAAVLAIFLVGVWSSGIYAAVLGLPDPGRIVIDEACGQLLALLLVPRDKGWLPLLLCFVLFRFFDILKPFPIRKLESLPGGWGIMADDLGAALAAGLAVLLCLRLTRILGIS